MQEALAENPDTAGVYCTNTGCVRIISFSGTDEEELRVMIGMNTTQSSSRQ